MSLEDLPRDVWEEIHRYTSKKDYLSILLCSKEMNEVLMTHDMFKFFRFDSCQDWMYDLPSVEFLRSSAAKSILQNHTSIYHPLEEKRVHKSIGLKRDQMSGVDAPLVVELLKYYRWDVTSVLTTGVVNDGNALWALAKKIKDVYQRITAIEKAVELENLIAPLQDYWCTGRIDEKCIADAVASKLIALSLQQHDTSEFLMNRTVVLAAVTSNVLFFEGANPQFKSDRDIVMRAVRNDGYSIKYASPDLRDDKEIVLTALDSLPFWNKVAGVEAILSCISDRLKADNQVIRNALSKNWISISYASQEIRNDPGFVLQAIYHNAQAYEFAHPDLANDKFFALTAIQTQYQYGTDYQGGPGVYSYLSEALKKDRDVVLAAISQDPIGCSNALLAQALELRNDKDVVHAAIEKCPSALKYASPVLLTDKKLVSKAVERDFSTIRFAPIELLRDKDFMLSLIKRNYRVLQFAATELKADRDIILAAISGEPTAIDVPKDFLSIAFASEPLRSDKDIALAALKRSSSAISYISEVLREDSDIQRVYQASIREEQTFTSTKDDSSCIIC